MSASDLLHHVYRHVQSHPDRDFVRTEIRPPFRSVTYRQAWIEMLARRQEFAAAGVEKSRVILIFLPQDWMAISYYLGAIAHGGIASFMPLPSAKQDPDKYWAAHRALIDRIGPAAIVAEAAHEAEIRRNDLICADIVFIRARDSDDAAIDQEILSDTQLDRCDTPILQHSSGTTGLKKGVMLSHKAILDQIAQYASAIKATREDVVVSWLPLYHDMGLIACLIMPMVLGQTIVLLDPFLWVGRPGTLLEAITRHRGTLCWLPNFAFDHLTRAVKLNPETIRLDTMRAFINCSEPCRADTFRRFEEKFAESGLAAGALHICYAMAETTYAVSQTTLGKPPRTIHVDARALQEGYRCLIVEAQGIELISTGKPIEGTVVHIIGEQGDTLSDGHIGEICISSTSLFSGYYKLPDETAARLHQGLYRTRDRGFMLEGELFVLGRLDDLVIVAGRNFHAAEIEAVVNAIPGLKPGRNVAFGIPNEARGTADLVLVAETQDEATTIRNSAAYRATRCAIREAVFQVLGVYPAEVALVKQGWLQKTTSGKIERRSNADRFLRERAI